MIRQVNLIDCTSDLNTTNRGYLSASTYPEQKDSVGKWTYIRYKSEVNSEPTLFFYLANGEKCHKKDNAYYYDSTGTLVPERDNNGKEIIPKKVLQNNSVNNRFRLFGNKYKDYNIINSGSPTLFQILRYDDPDKNSKYFEHKVILRNTSNEVIVLKSEDFENIYDLVDSDMVDRGKHDAKELGGEYISPNTTTDINEFLDKYNNERIYTYHIQDDTLLGLQVYTEYEGYFYWTDSYGKEVYRHQGKYYYVEDGSEVPTTNNTGKKKNEITKHSWGDLYTKDSSFNKMDLYEYVTEDGDPLVKDKYNRYYYYDKYFGENDSRNEQYTGTVHIAEANRTNNRLTPRMRNFILKGDKSIKSYSKETLASFPYYHNNHEFLDSNIDIPRRAHNKGIIIRADLNGYDQYIVVQDTDDNGNVRYICQDEARFYYNTNDIHKV